jgi:transcription-repair coupling factor (superfamily II helicase)
MLPKWLKALWGGLPVPKSDCRVIWHALCAESAPILTAGLIEAQALPVLIITPSLERAERWLAVLLRLGIPESRLVRVPPALTPIMEPTGVEREVLHERIRAMRALLRREPVCLIVPLSAAMQRTMPPAQFEAECLRLGTAAPDSDESDLSNESDRVVQIEPEVLVRRCWRRATSMRSQCACRGISPGAAASWMCSRWEQEAPCESSFLVMRL